MIACWRIDSVDDDCCGCDGVFCEGVAGVGVVVAVVVGGCEGALKRGREDGCFVVVGVEIAAGVVGVEGSLNA